MALELYDKDFLLKLDQCPHRKTYCKIIALNWSENPVAEITSNIVNGSINVDGSSAVRRTASLSLVTNTLKIDTVIWRAQTKIRIFVGLANDIDNKYDDIIWFPQGVFVITSFNSSFSQQGYTINISAKDKMCLLNGDISGTLWASHDFSQLYITKEDNSVVKKYIPIYDIIREAIHTYANEPYSNIIINDLDECGVELLEYIGTNSTMYIFKQAREADQDGATWTYQIAFNSSSPDLAGILEDAIANNNGIVEGASITPSGGIVTYVVQKRIRANDIDKVAGYRATDLTYPGELTISVGGTINDLLSKIANLLGEFEYFYDLEGHFVFQRKKVYINTAWSNIVTYANTKYYDSMETATDLAYDFAHGILVNSFSNTPQLNSIKNDYSIWGTRKSISGNDINIHLRYAIDQKPTFYYSLLDQKLYVSTDFTNNNEQINVSEIQGRYNWRELIYKMAKDNLYANTAIESLKLALANGLRHYQKSVSWDDNDNKPYYKYDISKKQFVEIISEDEFLNCVNHNIFIFSRKNIADNNEVLLIEEIKEWQQTSVTGYEAYYTDMLSFWPYMYKTAPDFTYDDIYYESKKYTYQSRMSHSDGSIILTYINENQQTIDIYYGSDEIDSDTWMNKWETNGFWNPNLFYYDDSNNTVYMKEPTALYFWIDFCDAIEELSQYGINVTGRRSKYINDKDVRAIYFKETPSLLFVNSEYNPVEGENDLNYCKMNIAPPISNYFKISAQGKSAKEVLDALLYEGTLAQESISLSTIPIYYLEPNTRIRVFDENTNINGEYIIKSFSIPLNYDGLMNISATRAVERIL